MPFLESLSNLGIDALIAAGRQVEYALRTQPEIADALAPYGYDADEIAAGSAMLDALAAAAQAQRDRYGLQIGATADVKAARAAFHTDPYMVHAGLARIEFRAEPGTLARLALTGRRAQSFHGWAAQAGQFYALLLSDAALRTRVGARGITPTALANALAALDALAVLEREQENKKGLAQQSTRERHTLAGIYTAWLGDLWDTARIALRDHPDWLERLGFLAPSDDA
jgi:hypothetical protein